MERIFALYDSDSFYATRFLEYFKKKKDYDFEFSAFTRREKLEEFLLHHTIEILLLGDQDLVESINLTNVKYVYKLSDTPETDDRLNCPAIYKYQPARRLMNEIMSDYNRRLNATRIEDNSKEVRMISIYSPVQSPETVSFAWSLGALLSERKKILLVMLEPLPMPLLTFLNSAKSSLTEFIYYLKENQDSITKMISLLDYNGSLTHLSGVSHASDIFSLNREDINKWSEELKEHTDFYAVVFYLGAYTEATEELMKLSDTVYVTGTGTAYEGIVYEVWSQQMERSGVGLDSDKFFKVELQMEEHLGVTPMTLYDLKNTQSWNSARQSIKY